MRRTVAEKYRDIDFSRAKRGAVVKPEPGKTKISIRLDNTVIEFFRAAVDRAGGGNYQTLRTATCGGLTPVVSASAPRAAEPARSLRGRRPTWRSGECYPRCDGREKAPIG